ncbi:universal stress protein [Rickettsia prowazekii]|uniref:universal stress protein n=1 Tax=Rickettsia prowazekii TaxID=782 RepID=UPI0002C63FAE|nr:universal stress protein [Rickettsia prowazekii]AGJ02179.1 Universal stress protein UspA [Rickettsia prowazekii str. NMRC Madrid E]AGJ02648.1 Universal stress protein UspA [Rickettsia prowazekii str. Breinl]
MTKNTTFKNILIPIDLNDKKSIKSIFPKALMLAINFQAKLHFMYVIPEFGTKMFEDYLPKNWRIVKKEKYQTQIKDIIKQYIPDTIETDNYIGSGAVYDEIIKRSNEIKADLIIISAVRLQLKDYMLGPNASKIVRHSDISVLVLRDE